MCLKGRYLVEHQYESRYMPTTLETRQGFPGAMRRIRGERRMNTKDCISGRENCERAEKTEGTVPVKNR